MAESSIFIPDAGIKTVEETLKRIRKDMKQNKRAGISIYYLSLKVTDDYEILISYSRNGAIIERKT